LVEVRRIRRDLEETLTIVAQGDGGEQPILVDPGELADAEPLPTSPLRAARATFRVAREIASDLVARKMAHAAGAGALLVLAAMGFALRNQIVQGMAATARQFSAGGLLDDQQLANMIGRGAAAGEFWSLLVGSAFLSALFAPPLLEPRRSALLLAQPVSRGDIATGIFSSVCTLAFAVYLVFGTTLFVSLRLLGLPVSPSMLLVPLPAVVAFASLYSGILLATYLFPNGLFAGFIGMGSLLALLIAGNADAAQPTAAHGPAGFFFGLLPKLIGLHHQAMRLGSGSSATLFPLASTLAYALAVLLVVQLVARRSER